MMYDEDFLRVSHYGGLLIMFAGILAIAIILYSAFSS